MRPRPRPRPRLRRRPPLRIRATARAAGFTLVELMVVIVIIGILMGFVLQAAMDGVRRAEARATQELIIKLDVAVADRVEALLSTNAPITPGHQQLAAFLNPVTSALVFSDERAQVIAQADMMKYEMPDTFYVQVDPLNIANTPGYPNIYPINFAGQPWSGIAGNITTTYFVPLGAPFTVNGSGIPVAPNAVGIFGASYAAAAGIYKNLGYLPQGYDQQDNDNDLLVDEWDEGVTSVNLTTVVNNLVAHMAHPQTARSEMLYALLVEGKSPLASYMNPDDFNTQEVKDTDGDGLPEFIDAWGQPLQFYRWPTHYPSDIQKGYQKYAGIFEPRQLYALDPNQQLVAPAWWTDLNNLGQLSSNAALFQTYFFSLIDPNGQNFTPASGQLWDRSDFYQRRAFLCRHLIISSGPDQVLGLAQLGVNYAANYEVQDGSGTLVPINPNAGSYPGNSTNIILVENEAAPYDPNRATNSSPIPLFQYPVANATTAYLQNAGTDDISNHNVLTAGGGVR